MSNPVGWFEIYVQDMTRAKAFYEGVFGYKLERMPDPGLEYWMFPMKQEGKGSSGARSASTRASPRARTASWSTSPARTARSRKLG